MQFARMRLDKLQLRFVQRQELVGAPGLPSGLLGGAEDGSWREEALCPARPCPQLVFDADALLVSLPIKFW